MNRSRWMQGLLIGSGVSLLVGMLMRNRNNSMRMYGRVLTFLTNIGMMRWIARSNRLMNFGTRYISRRLAR